MKISKAFEAFIKEAPASSKAWHDFIMAHGEACALDKKTQALAYLSVLAAVRLDSGIPFHVQMAKMHGATKEEIISALLVGLPAAGQQVVNSLPIAMEAIEAYDASKV